jgi:hypothetical protein
MSLIINKMVEDFAKIGFSAVDGPELDEEWYNFDADSLSDRKVRAIMVASAPGSERATQNNQRL